MEDAFDIFDNTTTVRGLEKITQTTEGYISRNKISKHGTRHEALTPPNLDYTPLPEEFGEFPAKKYEFELDLFQKMSLHCLESDESVIVAAHTSSGKTVVAEYAIALSFKNNQRVIYTSPIKALSNQKFRELQDEFKDVGLMTGDVTINPNASCLVMTTEILRNMLYRGSEILREVHWIIFDEIHYMRDKERGVVWEETLILLKNVRMVFLSATIPNAAEFAGWVSINHNQVVHVIYTDMRPTPLTHYIGCSTGLIKIKEKEFDIKAFHSAMKNISKRTKKDENSLGHIIEILVEQNNLPAIVFSFSRKDCEKYAVSISVDFLTLDEKQKVETIFCNALLNLREEDRQLVLIKQIKPLLLRGIGIHHSGLLPIIKEVIEILFQENLIRILFATETFSIGLNMPCRTVVFTSLKKFDGVSKRLLTSGEYIQMSGRAGRRGIDKTGVVICITDQITTQEAQDVFKNNSDVLNSAFYLSYNMILNLKRVEGLDPLYLLSRSFYHLQKQNERTLVAKGLISMYEKIKGINDLGIKNVQEVYEFYKKRNEFKIQRCKLLAEQTYTIIGRGSIVDIFGCDEISSYFIGNAYIHGVSQNNKTIDCCYFVDGGIAKKTFSFDQIDKVYKASVKLETKIFFKKYEAYPLTTELDETIMLLEKKIQNSSFFVPFDKCMLCLDSSKSCLLRCRYIDAINDSFGVQKLGYVDDTEQKNGVKLFDNNKVNLVVSLFRQNAQYVIYENKVREYKKLNEIYHMDECQRMIRVLNRLGYCDEKCVLAKGKIACEISQGDELVLTEIIFNGEFAKMDVDDVVALLSCFVFEEWQNEAVGISDKSMCHYKIIVDTAEKINVTLNEYGLNKENYADKFSNELMDVVRKWSAGHTFNEICMMSPVFEGSIIRVLKRLEELLRQLTNASRVIGNVELENMFAVAITKIKRDIVFVASLYL